MLEDPKRHQFAYAIEFTFHVYNNEAEYEAFLARLQKTQSLQMTHLLVKSDSQVVVQVT